MSRPIRVVEVTPSFSEERLRTPLKFGAGVVTHVTSLTVEATIEAPSGERATGAGNILLSDLWAFPSANLSHEVRDRAMRTLALRACALYADLDGPAHPLDLSWQAKQALEALTLGVAAELSLPEAIPILAALVSSAPADAALHDAYGRLCGVSSYDACGPDFVDHDLSTWLGPDLAGRYVTDFVRPAYRPDLAAFHLVGGLDKLTVGELSPDDPDDGLPVSLDQWIERDGLICLKVKITGVDIDRDVERTAAVAEVAWETRSRLDLDPTFFLSADSNEMHSGPDAVVEYLRKLNERSPLAYRAMLYLEQPTARDLAADCFDLRPVAALKPVLADEGVTDLEKLALARELGWSGVALKTCKGHAASLLYAARALSWGMLLSVQDLTNPGLSLVHSAGLAGRVPTLMGFEYNARQYLPFSQEDVQAAHPDLFTVHGGRISLASLSPTGLGY